MIRVEPTARELAQRYRRAKEPRRRTRRDEIFDYVCAYSDEHSGNSPSIREIGLAFGLHKSTVYSHVLKLQSEHRVEYIDDKLVVIRSEWIPPDIY